VSISFAYNLTGTVWARTSISTSSPPDLIVEIDLTSFSLNKFPIYARLGVPEVWRYDGERVATFELRGEEYTEHRPVSSHERSPHAFR
jgi:Uma2 family endonuclease